MSVPWIVAGAAASSGVFWLALGVLRFTTLGALALLVAAALGGLASGGLIASHAPVRPQREPLLAAVLGLGLIAMATYVVTHGGYWSPLHETSAWLLLPALAMMSAGAVGGAELIRRLKRVSVSAVSVLLLSCAVHFGVVVALFSITDGAGVSSSWIIAISCLGVVLAAFLTQLAVPRRAPWASAGGIAVFPVINYLNDRATDNAVALVIGTLIFVLVGRLGSAAANSIMGRDKTPDLPEARMN